MIILFNQLRRRNSDNTKDATISVDEENNGIGLFISVDSCDDTNNKHSQDKKNESLKDNNLSGKVNKMQGKLSKLIHRRNKCGEEVKLTIEQEEKIEMSHAEIALWIDTKARWLFPLLFITFVTFYFVSIQYYLMDQILRHL